MRKQPSLAPLGESEMEILQLVWTTGPTTVAEIHARILETRRVAYTTVMSAMRKLADKGYLTFEQDGNAYVYQAARPPHEVKFSLLSSILEKVFKGSPVELVESLVRHEPMTEDEYREIRDLIDTMEARRQDEDEGGTS